MCRKHTNKSTENPKKKTTYTEIKKLLSSFIGIHVTFFEHCIDIFIAMLASDLLDILDRFPKINRNRNPNNAAAAHFFRW